MFSWGFTLGNLKVHHIPALFIIICLGKEQALPTIMLHIYTVVSKSAKHFSCIIVWLSFLYNKPCRVRKYYYSHCTGGKLRQRRIRLAKIFLEMRFKDLMSSSGHKPKGALGWYKYFMLVNLCCKHAMCIYLQLN